MKMTKKVLTAMIAASMAATALPAAAVIDDVASTLASSGSPAGNTVSTVETEGIETMSTPDASDSSTQSQVGQENDVQPVADAPDEKPVPSPESWFQTKDVEGGVAITGFNTDAPGFDGNIVIPPTINGKNVVRLYNNQTARCTPGANHITSLDFSYCSSVPIRIDEFAFYNCNKLESISNISNCEICSHAFESCKNLKTIGNLSNCTIRFVAFYNVPVESMGNLNNCKINHKAFYACSFSSIGDISDCTIDDQAFYNCLSLSSIGNISNCTIGENTFYECKNLKSIGDLSDCTIGEKTFYHYDKLESIGNVNNCMIDNQAFDSCKNLKSIGSMSDCTVNTKAFYHCENLKSVGDLTNSKIGQQAFDTCKNLTTVGDMSTCTSIGDKAFYHCENLESINDLSSCTSIGTQAFDSCLKLSSVGNMSSCTTIKEKAFYHCENLESVGDLSNCTSIGTQAFDSCLKLSSVGNMSSCTTIKEKAFYHCENLESVGDLSNCTSIEKQAFDTCPKLSSHVDLTNCTTIAEKAFYRCPNVRPVISTNATKVQDNAFNEVPYVTIVAENENALQNYCGNSNLKGLNNVKKVATLNDTPAGISINPDDIANSISLDKGYTYYATASTNNESYSMDNYQTVAAYDVSLKRIPKGQTTPSDVTGTIPITITTNNYDSTKSYAFAVNDALNSSTITPVETSTGIYSCTDMVTVSPTASLNIFCQISFKNTTSVALVSPDRLNYLYTEDVDGGVAITGFNTSAFGFNGNVVVPATIDGKDVVELKNNNGTDCMPGADQITSLDLSACESVTIDDYAFDGCSALKSANLSGCVSIGSHAFGCSGISGTVDLSSCTSIGDSAFLGCTGITGSIDLSNCTSIGEWAFNNCTGITGSIDLSNCTSIGEWTFNNCTGITGLIDLSNCTYIGSSAFANCSGITGSIDLSNCTYIGSSAFANCSGITGSIDLSNCTEIWNSAFANCSNITGSIDLSNCSYVGIAAFHNCSSITGINNLSNCTAIGDGAFDGCTGITGVVDLSNCTSIGSYAFLYCTNLTPVISTNTTEVGEWAFQDVVAISAESEEALNNYCAGITSDGKLSGLYDVKKIAMLSDNTDGISADYTKKASSDISANVSGLIKNNRLSSDFTYYLTTSVNDAYGMDNYQTVAAYDVAIKEIANGASTSTAMAGNVPLTISIPSESYDANATYYLSTDTTTPITLTENAGYYTYSFTAALSDAEINTIAIVAPEAASIVDPENNASVSDNDSKNTPDAAVSNIDKVASEIESVQENNGTTENATETTPDNTNVPNQASAINRLSQVISNHRQSDN